jgi:hypothetical protein
MHLGNLFTLCFEFATGEDTQVCDHCDVMDSVLLNLVGRKVTDVIMRRIVVELHHPIDKLDDTPRIDCGMPH